ncbi:MAG: calcium/sodium antiporter [Oscillospiraceae bacterium]|nr:calcium/sodium antiporter [Oscillospiraceae bacterium]
MSVVFTILLLLLGLALIIKGGDVFVDAAVWMAEATGIPKFIVGATVVSFATTLPELLVSVIATAEGKSDMAIGNAVGSVTANIGLIMAIALVCIPMAIKRRDYIAKSLLMLCAAGVIVVFGRSGSFRLLPCVILVLIFAAAMTDNVLAAKKTMSGSSKEDRIPFEKKKLWINVSKFVVGAAAIVWGADLLVDNGSALARMCGVPERVISVTLIAVGTSLPELVTTITAIVKKQGSLSVGNIIGANIIDLSLIIPVCCITGGGSLTVSPQVSAYDLPASLVLGAVAVIPALISRKFRRSQGAVMLALYIFYILLTAGIVVLF